jgi:succinyl-diaminopimelate desuccinylase
VPSAGRLRDALSQVDDAEVVALTRDLVRIPSVWRPGDPGSGEAAVAEHVERWFLTAGLDVELQQVAPGRPNVVAVVEGGAAGPALLLEGHTDVVTEGDPAEWRFPPFSAELAEGRVWGRGAADMKGGLAAAMVAAAAIRRSGGPARGRLIVGALVDEEGDMLGVRHLCTTAIGREVTAAIICEPEENQLCLEQRGVVWARVTLRGRMAHGAMPEAGVNPVAAVGALLDEARRLERRLRSLCGRSRHLRPPTVTPTIVQAPLRGAPQANVIPAAAEVVLDVRLTPGADEHAVRTAIDEACEAVGRRCAGVRVDWRPVNGVRVATRVDRDEALVQAMIAGVRAATGKRPVFGGVPGSTDGTILRMTLGIPIVTCGPGDRQIPHQVDEHVAVSDLLEAARIYVASALTFLEP